MASSPEDVILDLDNATDDVRITTPPPPYLPSAPHPYPLPNIHSGSLPPSYPSLPPPEYGQLVTDNAYAASKEAAELPRLKKTSQANPPPSPMLPPSSQATDAQSQLQQVGSQRLRIGSRQGNMPYLSYLVFSCCVVCSCGMVCGMTAFVLGWIANYSAANGDLRTGRYYAKLSLGLSVCGLIFAIIMVIVFAVRGSL